MVLNQLKTAGLLGALAALFLGVGYMLGGYGGMTIGLIFAIIFNFGSYFFSDKIVLKMYHAKPVTKKDQPEFYAIVKEVAQKAGIPMPKLYILPTNNPNAFATGRNPKHSAVACTVGIMQLLSKDELKGVIAHEMAHIKNRDILIQTIAGTIAAVISYVAVVARWSAIFGGFGDRDNGGGLIELLILGIITPLVAMLIQLAISRSREYLADETGAQIIHNPAALASALEKLDAGVKHNPLKFGNKSTSALFIANPFKMTGISKLLSTHPPMNERIKRLRSMQ